MQTRPAHGAHGRHSKVEKIQKRSFNVTLEMKQLPLEERLVRLWDIIWRRLKQDKIKVYDITK